MKFLKICEKAKKFLLLITQKEDIEKKKIEKLRKRIDEKISKLQQKIRNSKDKEEKQKLKNEKLFYYFQTT